MLLAKAKKDLTPEEAMAFENACYCLYYGYSKKSWNYCGLDEEAQKRIWELAFHIVAEEF